MMTIVNEIVYYAALVDDSFQKCYVWLPFKEINYIEYTKKIILTYGTLNFRLSIL